MSNNNAANDKPQNGPPKFLIEAASAINRGEHDKAIEIFKQNIESNRFMAYCGLGDVYRGKGNYAEALKWLNKAYEYNPDSTHVIESIGLVLTRLNHNETAIDFMCKALRKQKTILGVREMAEAMRKQGKGQNAAEVLEKMIAKKPQAIDLMFELAMLYEHLFQNDLAEQLFLKILKTNKNAITYHRLGCLYVRTGRMSDAIVCQKEALKLQPGDNRFLNFLAAAYIKSGQIREATKVLEEAVNKDSVDFFIHSTYIYHLHLVPEIDQQTIFEAHKQWGIRQAPMSLANLNHSNNPDPNRKLRIGYISPDFRRHSVGYIFDKLLTEHDRDDFELYGYANVEMPDAMTPKFMKMFYKYRNIFGVDDDAAAKVIMEDGIDILIDLAGHTTNNRLLVLARKPAPIQVTYLGYFDTTGMQQVDYIITDELLNPPDSQKYYVERFAYLPGGVCFHHPHIDLEVGPAPIVKNGYPTFGVFTNNLRFNSKLLQTWAEILKNVPDSRLLIGFDGGDDPSVQTTFHRDFEKFGVAKERIRFSGRKSYEEYMAQYSGIDISLDTFPENGGSTICDSLYMGVPVISQYGSHMNARVGLTILNRTGLGEYAAPAASQYIAKAVELTKDKDKIVKIRASLRNKMINSPLCNSKRLAKEVEAAYRQMWLKWCDKQSNS
ncbi:MAG: tetratricopeptide repeat protein [Planctomycetes bacterium ADurb.Bin401]|nr:MAG: tetratricopeptide repeat protein [Planctomycetes bacterium ADurb.Bin401]